MMIFFLCYWHALVSWAINNFLTMMMFLFMYRFHCFSSVFFDFFLSYAIFHRNILLFFLLKPTVIRIFRLLHWVFNETISLLLEMWWISVMCAYARLWRSLSIHIHSHVWIGWYKTNKIFRKTSYFLKVFIWNMMMICNFGYNKLKMTTELELIMLDSINFCMKKKSDVQLKIKI